MKFGFDLISDLELTDSDVFDWEGKSTSLFCLIAGNISDNLRVVQKTLKILSKCYHGVFFIDGALENPDFNFRDTRVSELIKLCSSIPNVVYLHNNVVIVDGIALVGLNGWSDNVLVYTDADSFQAKCNRYEDIVYLQKTIEKLQLHVDVKKIIIVSSSIPSPSFYFGESTSQDEMYPINALPNDTEGKISHWFFGTYNKMVDMNIDNVNFINNPKLGREPYYAKRIEINL